MARQQARRHRRERLAGVALAVLGVVVLVVALVALNEPNGHMSSANPGKSSADKTVTPSPSASGTPTTQHTTHQSGPTLSLGPSQTSGGSSTAATHSVPLIVLNNTTTQGLAQQAAHRFEAAGWKVTNTGNLTNNIISTCAYYDPSDNAAKSAAEALQQQFPTIKRVKPKFAELPSGPVVVVLTPDYSGG